MIGANTGQCESGARRIGHFAGVAGDRFPTLDYRELAKVRLQLVGIAKELEVRPKFQRVCTEQFDSLLEGVAYRGQPVGYVLRSLSFLWRLQRSLVIMRPGNRSGDTQRLPDATDDSIALAHRFSTSRVP